MSSFMHFMQLYISFFILNVILASSNNEEFAERVFLVSEKFFDILSVHLPYLYLTFFHLNYKVFPSNNFRRNKLRKENQILKLCFFLWNSLSRMEHVWVCKQIQNPKMFLWTQRSTFGTKKRFTAKFRKIQH